MRKHFMLSCLAGTVILSGILPAAARDIPLVPPSKKGGKPLMECLALRQTKRDFSSKALPPRVLSDLLYAADGINRPDGRKTVPTARNMRNQVIYAAMADGVYLYQPGTHTLRQVNQKDLRGLCGKQPFHRIAPVVLVYVAEPARVGKTRDEQMLYAGDHAGHASQNVYLFAASEGLATVVCGLVDRPALARALGLKKDQMVVFSQPVAYPAE